MVEWVELKWYDYLMIVAFISFVILAIWRLVGDSPAEIQVLGTFMAVFGAELYRLHHQVYGLNREIGEVKISMQHSFNKVREDIHEIKDMIKKKVK